MYKILSIDGGGIRGLIPAKILSRIEQSLGINLVGQFDLLAGTSTGGILALAFACGYRPVVLVDLYKNLGSSIFKDSFWDNMRDIGVLLGAKYTLDRLREQLHIYFGGKTLGQLSKRVLISSFDLDRNKVGAVREWSPKFFHNYPDSEDMSSLVVDIALNTAAAPVFFPTSGKYIDGGVVVNNPAMAAVAQALDAGISLDDIVVFSLGTGSMPRSLPNINNADWGLWQWNIKIIEIIMSGGVKIPDYQVRQLLGERYLRVNPFLQDAIGMDEHDRTDELERVADEYDLTTTISFLQSILK